MEKAKAYFNSCKLGYVDEDFFTVAVYLNRVQVFDEFILDGTINQSCIEHRFHYLIRDTTGVYLTDEYIFKQQVLGVDEGKQLVHSEGHIFGVLVRMHPKELIKNPLYDQSKDDHKNILFLSSDIHKAKKFFENHKFKLNENYWVTTECLLYKIYFDGTSSVLESKVNWFRFFSFQIQ